MDTGVILEGGSSLDQKSYCFLLALTLAILECAVAGELLAARVQ
jgi:hypothetical protein